MPRTLVWDGEGAVGRYRRGGPALTAETARRSAGTLGAKVVICKPADPEAKGLLERVHGYLETSFLPGRYVHRPGRFQRPAGACLRWRNRRWRRALGCAPAERIAADKAAMLTLPPVAPATGWRASLRLPRDHYVRLDTNDYSVDPAVIGRRIEVTAGLDRVRGFCEGQTGRRPRAHLGAAPDPDRPGALAAAQALRRQRLGHRPATSRAGRADPLPGRLRHRARAGRGGR